MTTHIQRILYSSLSLKVLAVIIGYFIWLFASYHMFTTRAVRIPLYFYNTNTSTNIDAPESVKVILKGYKHHLYDISDESLGIYIDSEKIPYGTSSFYFNSSDLPMSPSITCTHYVPKQIRIIKNHR
jgi:hypothetical protein